MRAAVARTSSAAQSPYNETDGIKAQTRYKTVSGYSYTLVSNPFRAATSSAETDAAMGWTLSTASSDGRHSEVETFAGSGLPTAFGGSNTSSTGIVRTDIDANATTVTDQAGKLRRSITNVLGQLIRVDEPNGSNQLGTISSPNQATYYAYDTLGNLTTVTQGVQTRTFTYNSLSRLLSATNPESGTINYSYDSNGNLSSKTDARSITTSYAYDTLNRVTARNYSDSTPDVSYFYDNLTNAKGKLIKVENAYSKTEYQAFDILGRVTQSQQTTDGTAFDPMTYTYNLSGALVEQKYPSGRVVQNTLDVNGDLAKVESKKDANDIWRDYANNFKYTAAGAIESMRLGNGKFENTAFNSRLQPVQIGLGSSASTQDLLKLNYDYGTTDNNGNVLAQIITVERSNQSPLIFTQTYSYDSLNRLKQANEMTGTTENWKQTYSFDRYGNRQFDVSNDNTTTLPQSFNPDIYNPTADASNNRLASGQGYTYDAAGNLLTDAEGRQFTYDAENKQAEVRDAQDNAVGQYYYDGDGKRIKKYVPGTGETTIFVYNASGQLTAEYSTTVSPTPKIQYLTADHLGTPRINTDELGSVVSRTDYMPYGEEIIALGGRTSTDKYIADDVRQGFTGYENDPETGLDFAQARIYSQRTGRFTSGDPILTTGRPYNPKTWNRYSYTLNNPIKNIDPTGLYECTGSDKECGKFADGLKKAKEQLVKIEEKYTTDSDEYRDAVRALNSYGCDAAVCGDSGKNGVFVGFGELSGKKLGSTIGTMRDTGSNTINVTIDLDKNGNDTNLLTTIAHEGSHVADNSDFQSAMLAASNISEAAVDAVLNGNLRVTHGQSETRAYGVSSVFSEFVMGGGDGKPFAETSAGTTTLRLSREPVRASEVGGEAVWKSSWKKLDVDSIRSKRSAAIAKGLSKSEYKPILNKFVQ